MGYDSTILVRAVRAAVISATALLTASSSYGQSTRTLFMPTGVAAGDNLGHSVASAGDINGDGYADVIVGAPQNDAGGTNAGRAYVYYGSPTADATPELTLTGPSAGYQFGLSVASAGDVNGDGYSDLIVGAPSTDPTIAGRAYIYYGGLGADPTADLTLNGVAGGDRFGYSVASAGDINGDGYADVIVGAPQNDAGGLNAGRAYVFYGSPAPDASADLTLTGAAAGDQFGFSVASAGDFNGDGYADLIVGAPLNDTNADDAGRAYIFYGSVSPDASFDLTLRDFAAGDQFGFSVASAGDVNGDGYADVIVGAPFMDYNVAADIGSVSVFYGGFTPDTNSDRFTIGDAPGDQLGFSVASGGNSLGTGLYDDYLMGVPWHDAGGSDAGRLYRDFGDALTGDTAGDHFGYSVASAGDVNGDGIDDLVIGAPQNDEGGPDAGRAYVVLNYYYEVLAPNGGEQWVAGQPVTVRWRGHDTASLAISTDGGLTWNTLATAVGGLEENEFSLIAPALPTSFARVRVSVPNLSAQPYQSLSDASDGVFRIVLPATPPASATRLQLAPTGAAVGDQFGHSVASAGDVNGDGYADLIVGAAQNDASGTSAGRAYVYYGGPGGDAVPDLTLTGAAAGDFFGYAVASAGDVNGDGFGDLIVGAWGNDAGGSSAGRAYVYYGGPGADATADLTLTGAAANDQFGWSVASAGDINGDGYSDVIAGAYFNGAGGTNAGRAYVYYGGPGADAIADLTLTGVAGDFFGYSVASAGDVNGDGFADVIVGAYLNSTLGPNVGRAYVYYGGPGADAIADLILTGAAAFDNFGYSVASAGDVNGDGFADMIVGAIGNDAGGSFAGRAYVYYGGPGADAVPDLTLTGDAAGDQLGTSVASAGDINGDGFADLVVGAIGNDASGPSAGRVYVYVGGPGCDATADFVLNGPAADDLFGTSAAGAGDVNGDGFADLIVGAYQNDAGGADAGRGYLYDFNRYHLLSPIGGETWNVGGLKQISWLGAEPADVWLSSDGGNSYQLQLSRVGGAGSNKVSLRVPHTPSKFARIRVTPADATLKGFDQSDSLFTVQTSVALLSLLAAPAPGGARGAVVSWSTDPGPSDLAGYRLERGAEYAGRWTTLVSLTKETSYRDPDAAPASVYRLYAVNGFGEEVMVGETSFAPRTPLAAWPLPYRGGRLSIAYAAGAGLGGELAPTEVNLVDVRGRLVRTVARGERPVGYHAAFWDGRDDHGLKVAAGIYFLRLRSAGEERTVKVVVLR